MSKPLLKSVCLEIQNENLLKWKERKKKEIDSKEKEEAEIEEDWKRACRQRKGERKKEDLLRKLSKEGKIKKTKRNIKKVIEEKQKFWRNYRDTEERDDEKEIEI